MNVKEVICAIKTARDTASKLSEMAATASANPVKSETLTTASEMLLMYAETLEELEVPGS